MIRLTRLNHQEITINADLIEHLESTPDTLIKMVNGQTIMVRESIDEVVERIVHYKRQVLGLVENLSRETVQTKSNDTD